MIKFPNGLTKITLDDGTIRYKTLKSYEVRTLENHMGLLKIKEMEHLEDKK